MALDQYALASLRDVKQVLRISASTKDDLLTRYLEAASALVEAYCSRLFKSRAHTVYLNGDGSPYIVLPYHPVTAVAEVNVDPDRDFDTSTVLTESDDFHWDEDGIIHRFSGVFPSSPRSIKITFTAGATVIPAPVRMATIELVRMFMDQRGKEGIASETIGSYSVTYREATETIPPATKLMLEPYLDEPSAGPG